MFLSLQKESLENNTKVTLVLWPLWSWKTSLVKRLLPHYPDDTILIINDVWAINIDSKRIKWNEIVALQEWCVCCEDIKSLREALIKLKWKTKNIIIEPSWIAEWTSIKKVLTGLWYDVSTIFLWDVEHHRLRDDIENQVIKNQIRVADIVWLTWNSWDKDAVLDFQKWLDEANPWIKTIDIPLVSDNQEYSHETEDIFRGISQSILTARHDSKKKVFQVLWTQANKEWSYFLMWNTNKNHSHKAPVFTISREISIDLEQLKNILDNYKTIIRAKWIVWNREFDYVHWSLTLWKYSQEKPYITFISTRKIDFDLIESDSSKLFIEMKNKQLIDFELSPWKISTLVEQYHEYMDLENQIQLLKEELKNSNNIDNSDLSRKITLLQLKQKHLWESMKYDNPFIWIEYKRLAYVWTSSKIETIWELRSHCASPTYICHKRLMFLNSVLKTKYSLDIFDSNIDENMTIEDFLQNGIIQEISSDSDIMKYWLRYEYFEVDNRVAKWENFSN